MRALREDTCLSWDLPQLNESRTSEKQVESKVFFSIAAAEFQEDYVSERRPYKKYFLKIAVETTFPI